MLVKQAWYTYEEYKQAIASGGSLPKGNLRVTWEEYKQAISESVELPEGTAIRGRPMDVHEWFGLSYANYLVIPRSILESMPDEWQHKFVSLLKELDRTFDLDPAEGLRYQVRLMEQNDNQRINGEWGDEVDDPLAPYRHPNFKEIESRRIKPI